MLLRIGGKLNPETTNHTRGLVQRHKGFYPFWVFSVRFPFSPGVRPSLPGNHRSSGRCLKCASVAVINSLPPQSQPTTRNLSPKKKKIKSTGFKINLEHLTNHSDNQYKTDSNFEHYANLSNRISNFSLLKSSKMKRFTLLSQFYIMKWKLNIT